MDPDLIDHIFTYHPPTEDQRRLYEAVRFAFRDFAQQLARDLPDGPGKTVAIRKLHEANLAINSCIALGGRF